MKRIFKNIFWAFIGTLVILGVVILSLLVRAYAYDNPNFGFVITVGIIFSIVYFFIWLLSKDEKENLELR